jgi:AcrR family transcriptional regulator
VSGRPRSVEADDAILDAAICVFCEQGYEGLTVEGVAARAGVGKTTIYRRYPAKLDLVMAAVESVGTRGLDVPDTGSLRADLRALADSYLRMLRGSVAGRAIPMTLAAKSRNPELAAAHEAFVAQRRSVVIEVIRRGIGRGELPAGSDPTVVADMLTGALFMRVFVTGGRVTAAYLDELIERLLGG